MTLWIIAAALAGAVVGCVATAFYCRRKFQEQHALHEECEDAAYMRGLETGRAEPRLGEGDVKWYDRGYSDGKRAGMRAGRKEMAAALVADL
jgi:hypothetical protein